MLVVSSDQCHSIKQLTFESIYIIISMMYDGENWNI